MVNVYKNVLLTPFHKNMNNIMIKSVLNVINNVKNVMDQGNINIYFIN